MIVWLFLQPQIELHQDNNLGQDRANIAEASRLVQLHEAADSVDQPIAPHLHGKNVQLRGRSLNFES